MNFLQRLRPALVIVLPACGGMNATGDAATPVDVVAVDRPDVLFFSENPPIPLDSGLFNPVDAADVTTAAVDRPDAPMISENPPAPIDSGRFDPVDASDASSSPDAPPTASPPDASPTDSGCPAGQRFCDGRCVDVGPLANACTSCGLPCCASARCMGGRCEVGCAPGWSVCDVPPISPSCEGGGTCVPLQEDPRNCGRCGNVCPTGQSCRAGACAP